MLPQIESYGRYSSDNYGAHCLKVVTENMTIWYSYDTIVAYRDTEDGRVISENIWGPTTGKHLNWICEDKSCRLPREEFLTKLKSALERHFK